jgi:hypothetical protein
VLRAFGVSRQRGLDLAWCLFEVLKLFFGLRGQDLNERVEDVIGCFNRGLAFADRAGKLFNVRAKAAFLALLKDNCKLVISSLS